MTVEIAKIVEIAKTVDSFFEIIYHFLSLIL